VSTPDRQMADNDYAVGLVVDKVSKSRFASDTLIFVVEDDAQNGPDHVDAHRSIALVAGAYVKEGEVVSTDYDTVSMVKTIEVVLGIEPMGITDAFAPPMSDLFAWSRTAPKWSYDAIVPEVLRTSSQLPLPPRTSTNALPLTPRVVASATSPHDAAYWAEAMRDQDFTQEDRLDTARFNQALWNGLKGERK
jgi:hypothetical protein